jgi:hypothetical protein
MRRLPTRRVEEPRINALLDFHKTWGYIAIVANGIAGVIALIAWRVPRLRGRWVWGVTIAAEAAMMVQVLIGVILVSNKDYTPPRLHMFYGFVAFLTVGLALQFRPYFRPSRDGLWWRHPEFLYGLVGLFLVGVGIRAVLQVTG